MPDDVLTWALDKIGFRVYRSAQVVPQQGTGSTTVAHPLPSEATIARQEAKLGIDVRTKNQASNYHAGLPPLPAFSDIGSVAKVANIEDTQTQLMTTAIMKDIPIAGPIFSLAGFSGPQENAAGLSPEQMAWLNKATISPSTGMVDPLKIGTALALVEGRQGTKQILNDEGDYIEIGGVGLGGPGFSNMEVNENPVRFAAESVVASPPRMRLNPQNMLPKWTPGDHPHVIQQDVADPADPLPDPGDDPTVDMLEPIALHRGERPTAFYNPGAVTAAFASIKPDTAEAENKREKAARQEYERLRANALTSEPIYTPDFQSQGDTE